LIGSKQLIDCALETDKEKESTFREEKAFRSSKAVKSPYIRGYLLYCYW